MYFEESDEWICTNNPDIPKEINLKKRYYFDQFHAFVIDVSFFLFDGIRILASCHLMC